MKTKNCYFCTNNVRTIDYKNIDTLGKFVDSQAKILPKKETTLCVKHQRRLAQAIKRARFLGFIEFVRQ